MRIYIHKVSQDFFETMSIPLIKGRVFSSADVNDAPQTAVVSRKLAARVWPNQDAIGKRIKFGRPESEKPWMTIIGVVDEVKHRGLVDDPVQNPDDPDLYVSMAQYSESDPVLLIRTDQKPKSVATLAQAELQKLDRDIPVYSIRTMDELVSQQMARPRFLSFLMMVFAGVALGLACIGLFGVLNDVVAQQTKEIAVRIALGATRNNVVRMVVSQATTWALSGLVAGFLGAVALGRLIASQLYGVSATDPSIYAAVAFLMMLVTLAATCSPALRASRVNPITALKYE